ncbi:MAG: molybdate ABC transporter substrate-binding protein [Gammaproteobacteria bacterium]|nr:molybdate ABC transporter substrate-binding protein [Gammaproteobacteria bacterium]
MRMLLLCGVLLLSSAQAVADEVKIAVASNFLSAFRVIKSQFEHNTGHKILLSSASTGKLFAQITHGAPFEIFMAADNSRPKMLEDDGLAIPGSRYLYAKGRLVLWSASATMVGKDCRKQLEVGQFNRLSIANPKTAPYGEAARQALKKMGLWDSIKPKLVRGENIGQTFQYVITGNAELGIVALSQVLDPKNTLTTCRWDIPAEYYESLDQELVVLKSAENNPSASEFIRFLKTDTAKKIIAENGYGI